VTLEECNAAIAKYMKVDDLAIAIVTNKAAELREQIAAGDASPMVYAPGTEKSAETLAEDKLIAVHPLKIALDNIRIVPVSAMFAGAAARNSMR
jgi:hypothetical protein